MERLLWLRYLVWRYLVFPVKRRTVKGTHILFTCREVHEDDATPRIMWDGAVISKVGVAI